MTNFNLENFHKDNDEWTEIALQQVGNDNMQVHVFGGFAVAVFLGTMAGPLTGGIAAIYVVYSAIEKGREKKRNLAAVKQKCLAHVLEGSNFRSYSRQIGHDGVMKELTHALQEELVMSDDALSYLESLNPTTDNLMLQQANTSKPQKQLSSFTPTSTELVEFREEIPDIVSELADVTRLIIYGCPGSGKDFLLSHINHRAKLIRPNEKIFLIDGKDDVRETGYFQGCVDKLYRKYIERAKPLEVYDWLRKIMDEFDEYDAGTGFKTLVVNELGIINQKIEVLTAKHAEDGIEPIKWWIQKLEAMASGGDSRGIKLRFANQNGHVQSMKFGGGTRSIFCPVVIVSSKEIGPSEMIMQASIMPKDKKIPSDQILSICNKSAVKRAIFHGSLNRWLPMPELENFSGYNRDKREYLARPGQVDSLEENQRKELRDRTLELNSSQSKLDKIGDELIQLLEQSQAKTIHEFVLSLNLSHPESTIEEFTEKFITYLELKDRKDLLTKYK